MAEEPPVVEGPEAADARPPGSAFGLDLCAIVRDHHQAVYGYAFRMAGNQADAEDLTQQTFLMAQQRLGQVREPAKILSWLFSVLRSCYLKSRRKQRPALAVKLDLDMDTVPQPVSPGDIDEQALPMALEDLPEEFRIVLLMFYFEDCSYKEIAVNLGIPIGTVMSRLARAKGHLRCRLVHQADRGIEARASGSPRRSASSADRLDHNPIGQ
jgi:RNA polymerase sigma-70 factor, ECF subfamily